MNAINTKVLPTKRKQVALFSSDPQFKREVATRLDALAIYDVRISETADFLNGPPAETRPGIVILDLANGELLGEPGIVAARALWAAVPLIAVSDELTSEKTRILVRMNASDWLHKPLDAKELLNAVTFHDTGNQGTKSRIITFISASGGAGATTIALSAAEFLASKSTERAASTCLVDLDFQSANCGAYL
ncbi:MAG: pilus assembly protein, partial [Mesorhizobium sp.]